MSLRAAAVLTGVAAVVLAAVTLALLAQREPSRVPIRPIDLSGADAPRRDPTPQPPIFAPRDDDDDDGDDDPFDDFDEIDRSREHGADDRDPPPSGRDDEDDQDDAEQADDDRDGVDRDEVDRDDGVDD